MDEKNKLSIRDILAKADVFEIFGSKSAPVFTEDEPIPYSKEAVGWDKALPRSVSYGSEILRDTRGKRSLRSNLTQDPIGALFDLKPSVQQDTPMGILKGFGIGQLAGVHPALSPIIGAYLEHKKMKTDKKAIERMLQGKMHNPVHMEVIDGDIHEATKKGWRKINKQTEEKLLQFVKDNPNYKEYLGFDENKRSLRRINSPYPSMSHGAQW